MNIYRSHPVTALVIAALGFGGPLSSEVSAQTSAPANPVKLTTATTADKTASVGLPDGWTLTNGDNGYVSVTGPHDAKILLGAIAIAKDGPAGPGAPGSDVMFALPFSGGLKEKLTTILVAGAPSLGLPKPAITYASEVRTRLPMCSRFLGTLVYGSDSNAFEGIICSLKPDWLGYYKNIIFLLQVPSSRAAEDRPVVEQIAASYRVTPAMFRLMLATYTALPPAPPGGTAPMMPGLAPYQDPTHSDCFDYNIIRESPPWEVPMHCGGIQPY